MKCSSLGDAFPPCLQCGHANYADWAESSPPFWPLVTEVVTGFLQALRIPTSEWNSKVLHFRWFCTEAMLATARGFCRKSQISPCSLDEINHRMDLCSGFKDIMTTLRCPQSCSLSRAWSVALLPSWEWAQRCPGEETMRAARSPACGAGAGSFALPLLCANQFVTRFGRLLAVTRVPYVPFHLEY